LFNRLAVSVDDTEPTSAIFPIGKTIRFFVRHNDIVVPGTVSREQNLKAWHVQYSLRIENELVDGGTIETGNRRLAVLTFVLAFVLAFTPGLLEPPELPWQVVLMMVCGSFACSLATMRLIVGDFSCMLPVQKK